MRSLSETVTPALRALLERQPPSPGKTNLVWRVAVGAVVAGHSSASLSEEGTLAVVAVDPRWRQEIRRMSPRIRARLDDLLGANVVRRLDIRAPEGDRPRDRKEFR